MNTEAINKKLHVLLGLEWHEILVYNGVSQCTCGYVPPKLPFPLGGGELYEHVNKSNHIFASTDKTEDNSGRIELLRIIKDKSADSLYCFYQHLSKKTNFQRVGAFIVIDYLTEQSGKHLLCNAVIEFLERKND